MHVENINGVTRKCDFLNSYASYCYQMTCLRTIWAVVAAEETERERTSL